MILLVEAVIVCGGRAQAPMISWSPILSSPLPPPQNQAKTGSIGPFLGPAFFGGDGIELCENPPKGPKYTSTGYVVTVLLLVIMIVILATQYCLVPGMFSYWGLFYTAQKGAT